MRCSDMMQGRMATVALAIALATSLLVVGYGAGSIGPGLTDGVGTWEGPGASLPGFVLTAVGLVSFGIAVAVLVRGPARRRRMHVAGLVLLSLVWAYAVWTRVLLRG